MTTICEMLVESGFEVRALGTTASETGAQFDALEYLRGIGCDVTVEPGRTEGRVRPELLFTRRGIGYRILDIGHRSSIQWQRTQERQFDLAFDDELHNFQPDFLFTFGGFPGDVRRHQRARRQGVKIVFGLRNEGYLKKGFFDHIDGVLASSQFLSDRYRAAIGLESTPLPSPIDPEDIVAEEHDPIFVTMINPSPEKGLMFFARLAEELSVRRTDIPILVIESRGTAGKLAGAALACGFDLQRHENVMFSPSVPKPKDIFVPAKMLLVPSLIEASGRVAAEALLNGVPPLVSDRGGLAETLNGAGFVLPLPPYLKPHPPIAVPKEAVEPWIEAIVRLEDDAAFYEEACKKAKEASRIYLRENLAPRYADFFKSLA